MLAYYGYTISPNQLETGEGFLICRNVPIARTGTQEYLGREIGLTGADADQIVTVYRFPEEVFADAALASFEGKPATNDHPPDLIGPDDAAIYEKGHAQNIRRGSGEWADYILADLHIHDRELIDAIQGGKREISCGYACEYVRNSDGTYSQKNIRGNHIAVVDRGRAGKLAAILDSDTVNKKQAKRPERKAMKKNGLFFKLFGQAVKDKSPEEIEQLAMDAAEAFDEEAPSSAGEPEKKEETADASGKETPPAAAQDEEAMLDDLVEKIMARMAAKNAEKKDADPLDEAIAKLSGNPEEVKPDTVSADEEASRVVPAEEMDKDCGMDKALAVGILKAMRPVVAAIKDEAQRRAVSDALLNCVAVQDGSSDISAILQVSQKNAKRVADNKPAGLDNEAVQALYDNMNPHRRKEIK